MRRTTTTLLLLTGLLCPVAAVRGSDEPWKRELTGVAIPMRDGKALVADVYLPEAPGRYPAILIQTPYNRKNLGAALPAQHDAESLFDREHYAVVVLDWRGFHDSLAARQGSQRPQIGKDGYDAVEWVARQSWSDGKVGTWGPSALGRVQFATALEQPPHLVCCVPLVAPLGFAYDDYYENGVLREADVRTLDRLGFDLGRLVRPATLSSDPLYAAAARLVSPEKLQVPMLMITGWYDHSLARHIETFETLRSRSGPVTRGESRLVIGPWHHMALGKVRQGALEYPGAAGWRNVVSQRFLDAWLRDQKTSGWREQPFVQWWQMGEERWLSAESLSAVKTSPVSFALGRDGTLSREGAGLPGEADTRSFRSDPNSPVPTVGGANLGADRGEGLLAGPQDQSELERRDDVLTYSTAPLVQPLRLFGQAALRLTFAIDQKDASFAVRLCDVYPDGRSMLVCDGIARARYREGPDHPADLEPGQPARLTLKLPPIGLTIVSGHRLRISISGSNYPRYELNPQTGADHYDPAAAVATECTIFHGGGQSSSLIVPVLEGY